MSDTMLAAADSSATEVQSTPAFVHLRTHSEYSVVDGTIRIGELIKQAKQFNQPALALSDLGNLFGYIYWPCYLCDLWIGPPTGRTSRH